MLRMVISGGQSGADQAGWRAAKRAGLATGGWMPRGFQTEDGSRPEFARLFGAEPITKGDYRDRTAANVESADLTLWFGNMGTPGFFCTGSAASRHKRHFFVAMGRTPDVIANVVSGLGIAVLNIAGNRESKNPGIGDWTEKYLDTMFAVLKEMGALACTTA